MRFLPLRIVPLSAALAFLIAAAPASAAPKDACALVSPSQVQRLLGAGTTITANNPPRRYKGILGGALCMYTTSGKHMSSIAFASYASPSMARAFYGVLQRAPADQRASGGVKGNTVVWGAVHDIPGGKLNRALSQQFINTALGAL